MILASHGIVASSISQGVVPLLDVYGSAAAAYSVRKLRTAYTGSAIRVRRSSDNAESDIGFSGGNLDTTSLTSFCGSSNGFVTTWYDQSGNGLNVTQTTAANQPQIVSSGSVILQNSKPAIYFDGINDVLNGISLLNYITASTFSNIAVFNPIALTTNSTAIEGNDAYWMDGAAGYAGVYWRTTGNLFAGVWDGSLKQASVGITANTQITAFAKLASGFISISKNNGTFVNAATNQIQAISQNLTIAKSTVYAEINAQELIFYKTDQTSNVSGINNNVNSYYAIY